MIRLGCNNNEGSFHTEQLYHVNLLFLSSHLPFDWGDLLPESFTTESCSFHLNFNDAIEIFPGKNCLVAFELLVLGLKMS